MSLKDEIEVDILKFFDDIDVLGSNNRKEILRGLLQKYAQLSSDTLQLDYNDLYIVVDNAKILMGYKTMPMFLGKLKKRVAQDNQAHVCLIESAISYLNSKDCFKRLPKFDYRDNKF